MQLDNMMDDDGCVRGCDRKAEYMYSVRDLCDMKYCDLDLARV